VQRHLGPTDAREATKLYAVRSRLVHDGLVPNEIEAVCRQAAAMVAKLLARILSTGRR
jgi:hypothetical protein